MLCGRSDVTPTTASGSVAAHMAVKWWLNTRSILCSRPIPQTLQLLFKRILGRCYEIPPCEKQCWECLVPNAAALAAFSFVLFERSIVIQQGKEFHTFPANVKVHCHVHRNQPVDLILNQINRGLMLTFPPWQSVLMLSTAVQFCSSPD